MTAALFPYKKETGFACIQIKPVKKSHVYGGKAGIRTLGTVARSPHFECGPIDHSGTFPYSVSGKAMQR